MEAWRSLTTSKFSGFEAERPALVTLDGGPCAGMKIPAYAFGTKREVTIPVSYDLSLLGSEVMASVTRDAVYRRDSDGFAFHGWRDELDGATAEEKEAARLWNDVPTEPKNAAGSSWVDVKNFPLVYAQREIRKIEQQISAAVAQGRHVSALDDEAQALWDQVPQWRSKASLLVEYGRKTFGRHLVLQCAPEILAHVTVTGFFEGVPVRGVVGVVGGIEAIDARSIDEGPLGQKYVYPPPTMR